jgi:cation transport ATPase
MKSVQVLRLAIVLTLLASATLFAIGAAVERHHERTERHVEATPSQPSPQSESKAAHSEGSAAAGAERRGEHAGESKTPATPELGTQQETKAERHGEQHNERIFGVNPDALPLVVGAVLVSLLLAAAVWIRPSALAVLAGVVALGVGAAVFDIREAFHQADVSRTDVMVIAIIVAALHALTAACAGLLARMRPKRIASP